MASRLFPGLKADTPEYMAAYHAAHREEIRARKRLYNEVNRKRHYEQTKKWREEHAEERNNQSARYRVKHPDKLMAAKAKRRAIEFNAVPPWVNLKEIELVYTKAAEITKLTGIPHEVDHIWALNGKGFNGLHVPWNLQILTRRDNRKKGNNRPGGY